MDRCPGRSINGGQPVPDDRIPMNDLSLPPASLLDAEVGVAAHPDVAEVIGALRRTEDCRFSPDGRHLAVAGYAEGALSVFHLAAGDDVQIEGCAQLVHPGMREPHGLDFVDDATLEWATGGAASRFSRPLPPPPVCGASRRRCWPG